MFDNDKGRMEARGHLAPYILMGVKGEGYNFPRTYNYYAVLSHTTAGDHILKKAIYYEKASYSTRGQGVVSS